MKLAVLSFVSIIAGFLFMMSISLVFTYTTMFRTLSFALKNGIYQSGIIAMVPEIYCEWVYNPFYEQGMDEEEFIEVCEEVYLTKEEYYELLECNVAAYKQGAFAMKLDLMDYQPEPFLARATLSGEMEHGFLQFSITVDELVIEDD